MPYTRITPSAFGREAIYYARGGDHQKGHNDNEERNLLIGSVNMLPDTVMPFEDQMQPIWNHASSRNKTQVQRIIGSFSENELDPNDPNSPMKAMTIAQDFFEEYYPDRQVAIFVQSDGVGGKIHFHGIVNNVSLTDHKGCTDDQRHFSYIKKNFNQVAERYIELDFGDNEKDKVTQHERTMRQKNAAGENHYIWKDDLKERIRTAMAEADDRDDYFSKLALHGVEGTAKTSKSHGDYILYELSDISGFEDKVPNNLKARSYKLGTDFGYEALDVEIENHKGVKKPKVEPKSVPVKTVEQLEAEQKAKEEAEAFVAWCNENNINFMSKSNKVNFKKRDAAHAQYEEFLRKQNEVTEELVPEEAIPVDEGVIEEVEFISTPVQVTPSDDVSEDDEPVEELVEDSEDEEIIRMRERNRKLQEQLLQDADDIQKKAEFQNDMDDFSK